MKWKYKVAEHWNTQVKYLKVVLKYRSWVNVLPGPFHHISLLIGLKKTHKKTTTQFAFVSVWKSLSFFPNIPSATMFLLSFFSGTKNKTKQKKKPLSRRGSLSACSVSKVQVFWMTLLTPSQTTWCRAGSYCHHLQWAHLDHESWKFSLSLLLSLKRYS